MNIDTSISLESLRPALQRTFEIAADKIVRLERRWDKRQGTPVFTAAGKYTTRGWTEWTQGFQYGCMILAGDGLRDGDLIDLGRRQTVERMLAAGSAFPYKLGRQLFSSFRSTVCRMPPLR